MRPDTLHVAPGVLGLVLGIGATGGVLGTLVTKRLAAWLGVGRVYTMVLPTKLPSFRMPDPDDGPAARSRVAGKAQSGTEPTSL